jgi:hypothetical protein
MGDDFETVEAPKKKVVKPKPAEEDPVEQMVVFNSPKIADSAHLNEDAPKL